MQSYSHPDLFFCPLYNPPGIPDPKTTLCGSDTESQEYELWSTSDAGSSDSCSLSASPSVSLLPIASWYVYTKVDLRR